MSENEKIVEYWQTLSTFDRPPGFSGLTIINSKSIRDFCIDYDLDMGTYEKILFFEKNFFIRYCEIQEEKREKENKD